MLYATTSFQIWLEKLSGTSGQRSALSRLRTRGTSDQSALTVARTSEISLSQQKVRVNKQMNPPEIKDIDVGHHDEEENSAKEEEKEDKLLLPRVIQAGQDNSDDWVWSMSTYII